jgi:hypothetical protein
MRTRASIALLLPLACLLGCILPTTIPASTNSPSSPLSGNWSNWQIQTGTAITSPPNTYPSFLGAIQVQGTQAAGIFTTVVTAGTTGQPLNYSGAFHSSTEVVSLATFGYEFGYTQPATPYTLVPVGVIGGCVYPPTYTGPECLALIALAPSVGTEIAPLNGTYTGTFTESASTLTSPIPSGMVSLALTQSSTPNADGSFPLTGTLTFTGGGCSMAQVPLSGTVSGEGVALNWYSTAVGMGAVNLAASTNPTTSQITVSGLAFAPSPCATSNTGATTYAGTLTHQ